MKTSSKSSFWKKPIVRRVSWIVGILACLGILTYAVNAGIDLYEDKHDCTVEWIGDFPFVRCKPKPVKEQNTWCTKGASFLIG